MREKFNRGARGEPRKWSGFYSISCTNTRNLKDLSLQRKDFLTTIRVGNLRLVLVELGEIKKNIFDSYQS